MSILLKNVIRPEIFELSAYHVPPAKGMIKLDAMENPYPLSLTLREEIAQLAENATINRYPDPTASVLKNILRKHYRCLMICRSSWAMDPMKLFR